MIEQSQPEILEGVLRALRARHVPLGIRDYFDALRALHLGFGCGTRQELRKLCIQLWARDDAEVKAIDAVFALIPAGDIEDEAGMLERLLPPDVFEQDRQRRESRGPDRATMNEANAATRSASPNEPRSGVSFNPADEPDGLPLPKLSPMSHGKETYIYRPQTVISQRDLAVALRRLRKMTRTGQSFELDIQSTIEEKCRTGVLKHAVLRPPRRNSASLVVLADVSPSMAPWRPFLQVIAESLQLSRLRSAEILYFSNFPRNWVFRTPALDDRVSFTDIARANPSAPLLVVSDGGTARGRFSPGRLRQTERFLDQAMETFKPIVWINPMPRERWAGTSGAALAKNRHLVVLPLDEESLIRAVDVLRGARSS